MSEKIKYIKEPDETKCIAIRVHSCIVYMYPFNKEVAKYNPKIVCRDGRVVKKVQLAIKDDKEIVTGLLDEERLIWDINGRFIDAETDSDKDLYIFERYFHRNWKQDIKLSNSEFAVRYQRRHPYVKVPERRGNYYKGQL